jgi:nucleotide-binding universal stress UspA family protein
MMVDQVLLVTVDGSTFAEAVLPYAQGIATATKRRLRLLTVVDTSIEGVSAQPEGLPERLRAAATEDANRYLSQLAGALRSSGLEVETAIEHGAPAPAILGQAGRDDVALTLMATHGRSGIRGWVLGSVADKVLRLSSGPMLLVRPAEAPAARGALEFHHLVVPLDGSPLAERALQPATDLALATGARLTLLRVVPFLTTTVNWGGSFIPELGEIEDEMADDARVGLEASRSRLPSAIKAESVVLRGPPASTLESYLSEYSVDLTIMTTHGRGGLTRLALGSTAGRLVHAGLPLLLVHGRDDEPDQPANTAAGALTSKRENTCLGS